jgi:DNA/RNA-binding domain of Phe-tRNA-synthetase-like protein
MFTEWFVFKLKRLLLDNRIQNDKVNTVGGNRPIRRSGLKAFYSDTRKRTEMNCDELKFDIAPEALALGIRGAYFLMKGLSVKENDPVLEEAKSALLNEITPTLSVESIQNDAVLVGFRKLHEKVHVSNRKNVASPENLLSYLLARNQMPSINSLVDVYNLISIKTRLAIGAHDVKKIEGNIHLRLTNGTERFWPIGSDKAKPIGVGEYGYIDDANDVICRLETRQVEKTKVTITTSECFFIVQGGVDVDQNRIKAATEELIEMTRRFCGGEVRFLYKPWE